MKRETLPGITINIARAEIERHLANLDCGNPLTPAFPSGVGPEYDILALAGISHFAVFLHQGDSR